MPLTIVDLLQAAQQRLLADAGNAMRVYVPFGTQWYGYVVRRSGERPAHLTFFLGALAERGPQEPRPPGRREFR